jgi:hypothetical protein
MKLYDIASQVSQLRYGADLVGVDEDVLQDTLDSLEGTMQEKIEFITDQILQTQRFAEVCKAEEQRLYDRRKAMESRVERLKQYIQNCMTIAGTQKIQYALFSVNIQKNPPSVKYIDESVIPSDYRETKVTESINKKAILEALKNKVQVPGCQLEQGQTLRIK